MKLKTALPPHPPLLLTELDSAVNVLVSKLPAILGAMSSQLGVTMSATKQDKHRFDKRMTLLASKLRPFALVEMIAAGQLSVSEFTAAFHECLVRAYLEANGKRVPSTKHAMVYLVELSEGLLPSDRLLRRRKEYSVLSQAIQEFTAWVVDHGTSEQIDDYFGELSSSTEMTKHWQFMLQLDTLQKRWCAAEPKRFSWGTVHKLSDEFRDWGPFIESRMKVLVGLYRTLTGKPGWQEVQHQKLNNLQQMARAAQPLVPIADSINRNVRNALAHGLPFVDPKTKTCRFVDQNVDVRWSMAEFFRQTRKLRLSALALARFEATLIGARVSREVRQSFEAYWQAVQPAPMAPTSDVTV